MTEKTLFVHAGGSKTGSSALQNFFEVHASRLARYGVAYENRLNIESDYDVNSGNGMLLYEALFSAATTDDEIDSLLLSYFGQCESAICSSEYFAELGAHPWKRFLESSARVGVIPKVIFYVRNVIPFLQSGYDQVIKRHGEWRQFDEWVSEADWQHARTLRIIADVLPKEHIHVLHYDRVKTSLIRSLLNVLGVGSEFIIEPADQERTVNRSLTAKEREALFTVNRVLGAVACSGDLSNDLSTSLINANPNARGEPVSIDESTADILVDRFNAEVDWVNSTFFNGQAVVSTLPIEPVNKTKSGSSRNKSAQNYDVEKIVLDWALKKLKTIKDETAENLFYFLNNAAFSDSESHHPDVPADFSSLAYLLLNMDVLQAGSNPIRHFVKFGKAENRAYKFANTNADAAALTGFLELENKALYQRIEMLNQALQELQRRSQHFACQAFERERALYVRLERALSGDISISNA